MSNTNYSQSFEGIVNALTDTIFTVSGVGTSSFTLSSEGYPSNFAGVVQAITDLNYTLSGISTSNLVAGSGVYLTTSGDSTLVNTAIAGGSGTYLVSSGNYLIINSSPNVVAGSGVYLTTSGQFTLINNAIVGGSGVYLVPSGNYLIVNSNATSSTTVAGGSGIYLTSSGSYTVINATVTSASGTVFTAGSGLYLVNSSEFNVNFDSVFQSAVSGHVLAGGTNTAISSGNYLTISGTDINSIRTYTTSESIASGQFVAFDSGSLVVASAASGVSASRHNVFGSAVNSAAPAGSVRVNSDSIVTIYGDNITAEAQLTPGEPYYLSKYSGQLTKFSTASGNISFAEGYGALVYVGRALSTDQLEVEIQPKIILTE
jgi:hypothetical protein